MEPCDKDVHRPSPSPRVLELLFHAMRELPETERGPFLRQECGEDHGLLERVRDLVRRAEAEESPATKPGFPEPFVRLRRRPPRGRP